jgi:hypothetical protein
VRPSTPLAAIEPGVSNGAIVPPNVHPSAPLPKLKLTRGVGVGVGDGVGVAVGVGGSRIALHGTVTQKIKTIITKTTNIWGYLFIILPSDVLL